MPWPDQTEQQYEQIWLTLLVSILENLQHRKAIIISLIKKLSLNYEKTRILKINKAARINIKKRFVAEITKRGHCITDYINHQK